MTLPQSLDQQVRLSRDYALNGDIERSRNVISSLIMEGTASVDDIKEAMVRADPERIVWAGPVTPDMTGECGFPLIEGRYILCSDIYGHEIDRRHGDAEAFEDFLAACERGYDDTSLHGRGHVVFDRMRNKYAFMVREDFDQQKIDPAEVAQISARLGIPCHLLAFSHQPIDNGGERGWPCITALVEKVEDLEKVQDISWELSQLVSPVPIPRR